MITPQSSDETSQTPCPACGEAREPGFAACWACGFEFALALDDTTGIASGEVDILPATPELSLPWTTALGPSRTTCL